MLAAILLLLLPLAPAADNNEDFFAAARRGDAKSVEELLKKGVDVNAKYRYDQTALFPACDHGHIDVVKVLLEHGADVNVKDSFYGATPLSWASDHDHVEIVLLLLKHGLKDKAGVLAFGVSENHPNVVKAALDAGGIEAKDLTSSLRKAQSAKRTEIVELLTKAGAVLPPTVEIDAATLASYSGAYKPITPGPPDLTWVIKEGKLSGGVAGQRPLTLYATDKVTFKAEEFEGIAIIFKVEDGKVTGLTLKQGPGFEYKKVEAK
jgi:hypothetical protein